MHFYAVEVAALGFLLVCKRGKKKKKRPTLVANQVERRWDEKAFCGGGDDGSWLKKRTK